MRIAAHTQQQAAGARAARRPFSGGPAAPPPAARRGCCRAAAGRQPGEEAREQAAAASRRQALLGALLAPAALGAAQLAPRAAAAAADAAPAGFAELADPILAYSFIYPVATAGGEALQMTLTHPPEKYSSAAPLSADARQRIVSEVFDLRRFVTVSMTVGPASGVLRDAPQEAWKPRDVALTVLIDRSTARLSSGQRTALNDIEEAHAEERGGQTYYVYEHTTQGSPTVSSIKAETYRHALAVTTTRPGLDGKPYLYTLNLSCPQALWADMAGGFKAAVDSFRLLPTTDAYIPPDQNPWLFF
ncbi:PPD5 [Scenedesmus sp. PABB004]|nr:PPD5 [Scenedesmus sp. PABB004]